MRVIIGIIGIVLILFTGCISKEKTKVAKYGCEYLNDSIYVGDFCFWDNNGSNNVQVIEMLVKKGDDKKYYNHFLFCLDTITNYRDFVCRSANFFEGGLPVAWGLMYPDCEYASKYSASDEEFKILKYNTIHGASLIVNSCLFDKRFSTEDEYCFYLFDKYYCPNSGSKKYSYLNDSLMNLMHEDIKWLCEKGEDDK